MTKFRLKKIKNTPFHQMKEVYIIFSLSFFEGDNAKALSSDEILNSYIIVFSNSSKFIGLISSKRVFTDIIL